MAANKTKNPCGKCRKTENPYETYQVNGWTWYVLKWNAIPGKNPYASAFCKVVSPYTGPSGELGDTYFRDFRSYTRTQVDPVVLEFEKENNVR